MKKRVKWSGVEWRKQLKVLSGHLQWVYGCSISPDGQMLCSVAGEKSTLLFLPRLPMTPAHVPLQPAVDQGGNFHTSSLRSVCFSPEGLYLATVADDRLLRIWALELETPVAFAPVKNGLCCTYFPHGGIIATGRCLKDNGTGDDRSYAGHFEKKPISPVKNILQC
ncbi:WD repeat and SOCS box-containing protein 2, partial [Ophiophagus hannah]